MDSSSGGRAAIKAAVTLKSDARAQAEALYKQLALTWKCHFYKSAVNHLHFAFA